MPRPETLYSKAKASPNNMDYDDLCKLAEAVGFEFKRPNGSHRIYKHRTIKASDARMNFQNDNGKAKPYQVRQLLDFIEEHALI